jgi:hypothetical protein
MEEHEPTPVSNGDAYTNTPPEASPLAPAEPDAHTIIIHPTPGQYPLIEMPIDIPPHLVPGLVFELSHQPQPATATRVSFSYLYGSPHYHRDQLIERCKHTAIDIVCVFMFVVLIQVMLELALYIHYGTSMGSVTALVEGTGHAFIRSLTLCIMVDSFIFWFKFNYRPALRIAVILLCLNVYFSSIPWFIWWMCEYVKWRVFV